MEGNPFLDTNYRHVTLDAWDLWTTKKSVAELLLERGIDIERDYTAIVYPDHQATLYIQMKLPQNSRKDMTNGGVL